jgi:hypothetical protein
LASSGAKVFGEKSATSGSSTGSIDSGSAIGSFSPSAGSVE